MTTRIISIPADFITALVVMRPVIGDASNHPGQAAAIAALDYLAKVPCDAACRCTPCCADKYKQVSERLDRGEVVIQKLCNHALYDPPTAEKMARLRERFGLPDPQSSVPEIPTRGDVGHLGPLGHVLKDRRKPIADLFGFDSFSWCYYSDRKLTSLETRHASGDPLIVEIADDVCAKQSSRLYGLVSDELNGLARKLGINAWWTPHVVDVLRGHWIPAPKDVRTAPHAFKIDQSGRIGPPEETCEICWSDPRNEVHHRVMLPTGGGVVMFGGGTALVANRFSGQIDNRVVAAQTYVMHADGTWSQK